MKKWLILICSIVVFVGWYVASGQKHHPADSSSSVKKSVASYNKKKFSTTDPASIWVVVNKTRVLNPIEYAPTDLVPIGNGQEMRKEAANALAAMFKDASAQGINLIAVSGYRSYQTQVDIYNSEVQGNGQAVADIESAKPGHSEHQTGWALDVSKPICGTNLDCFTDTKEANWVAANAYKYGYIVRYTSAKQAVTGYRAESWHIRYVGTDLSKELHKENVSTLEEFFNL